MELPSEEVMEKEFNEINDIMKNYFIEKKWNLPRIMGFFTSQTVHLLASTIGVPEDFDRLKEEFIKAKISMKDRGVKP